MIWKTDWRLIGALIAIVLGVAYLATHDDSIAGPEDGTIMHCDYANCTYNGR